jgi:hypothetical protein
MEVRAKVKSRIDAYRDGRRLMRIVMGDD